MNIETLIRILCRNVEAVYFHKYNFPFLDQTKLIFGVMLGTMAWFVHPEYSGSLVSFYSRPLYSPVLNTLDELYAEMVETPKSLGTVEGSSSFGIMARNRYGEQVDECGD